MRRPAGVLRPACLAALTAVVCTPTLLEQPAAAGVTDGTLVVSVAVDLDGSGGYEPEVDAPQPGVLVTVTDAGGNTAVGVTDDDGQWALEPSAELTGGRYFVTAELPPVLGVTPAPPSDSFTPFNSTVDVTTADQSIVLGVVPRPADEPAPDTTIPPVQPTAGPAERTRRAAATVSEPPRFAVGDRVWQDRDRDGRQDDDEPGQRGVSVQLLDPAGAVLASTTSQADGRYLFDDLSAGQYAVRFAGVPFGSKLSPAHVGSAVGDSDPDYTGVTPPFSLGVREQGLRATDTSDGLRAAYLHTGVDAGVAPLRFAVASVVWQDRNGDGLLDPADPAGGARVVLLGGPSGELVVASTRTDAQGRYLFAGLRAGTYRVRFTDLGSHRRLTQARAGTNRAISSAPDPATGTSEPFDLRQGAADLVPASQFGDVDADFVLASANAGTVGSYTIANRIWRDVDSDGVLDPGEPGVGGVRVELLDATGALVATTTTSTSGQYTFDRLPAGQYRLRLPTLPAGLHLTQPRAGDDPMADSDVYGNALTSSITVGDENPVERQVAAGLTTSAAAETAIAPPPAVPSPSTSPVAVARPGGELARTDGGPWVALLVGLGLAVGGAAVLSWARFRRPGSARRG